MQCWKKNAFQISREPPPFRKKQLVSLSSLWATGLLNYSQCSASLLRLAQIQVCFSAELLKLTVSGKPWLLILKLLSTVLLLPKINTCCNKLRLCVVKSFQSQIRNCLFMYALCHALAGPALSCPLKSQLSRRLLLWLKLLCGPNALQAPRGARGSSAQENGDWVCTHLEALTRAWSPQSQ